MKSFRLFFGIIILVLSGCRENVSTNPEPDQVTVTFQELLEEAIHNSFGSLPGISMSVASPDNKIDWAGSSGYDSKKKTHLLSNEQPFRIASITKTFIACAILRLHELDSLSITDPIGKYISEEHRKILLTGGYDPDKLTIVQCLNHTTGLYDYAMSSVEYPDLIQADPSRRWTRTEQLQGAMKWGKKTGEPGEKYSYGDTGYILLGEIIETYFNGDLARGLRSLLKFETLGIRRTWLETLEPAPNDASDPVQRYYREFNVTEWDPSFDLYGGGGLMSTCGDLTRFMQALFGNQVFDKKETLDLMLVQPVYAESYNRLDDIRYKDYRCGVWEIDIYGVKAYMHAGLWGTTIVHVPAYNSSFAVNCVVGHNDRVLKKAILIIKNLYDQKS